MTERTGVSRRVRAALPVGPLVATALVVLLAATALATPAVAAKRKKGSRVDVTKTVGATIPNATPPPSPGQPEFAGVITSTIEVGKRFKGMRIRDVNVTVQTTGGATDPDDDRLSLRLTAPNGATISLAGSLRSGTSIGPLTFDDESRTTLGFGDFARSPFELVSPYAGTAQPTGELFVMDDGPVRGRWTLVGLDGLADPPVTSILNSWRLQVVAGRPYLTKQRGGGA